MPKAEKYTYEWYAYDFKMGRANKENDWVDTVEKISEMELSELTILNSTDYLRAIYDFDELVVPTEFGYTDVDYDSVDWANTRQKAIQALIINSIEKSARFKNRLRYLKKA